MQYNVPSVHLTIQSNGMKENTSTKCVTALGCDVCNGKRTARDISLICDNSVTSQNMWFFQETLLKVLKCYNFLCVQRRHNSSPVESFANCVMTLYLLKVHMKTFISLPITKKCQILSCDTLVANERYVVQKMWTFF